MLRVPPVPYATVTAVTSAFPSPCHNRFVVRTAPAHKAGVPVCGRRKGENPMQIVASLTRPAAVSPAIPRAPFNSLLSTPRSLLPTPCKSLHFDGVTTTFHCTSLFYFSSTCSCRPSSFSTPCFITRARFCPSNGTTAPACIGGTWGCAPRIPAVHGGSPGASKRSTSPLESPP